MADADTLDAPIDPYARPRDPTLQEVFWACEVLLLAGCREEALSVLSRMMSEERLVLARRKLTERSDG